MIPEYHTKTARKRLANHQSKNTDIKIAGRTRGKAAVFTTCYGNYNQPNIVEDLTAVFEHNGIAVTMAEKEQCCGMPKLELGDLEAVEKSKDANIPALVKMIDAGGCTRSLFK